MNLKAHTPLIIGLTIPILMILGIAASVYLPQLFIKPHYDFLYVSGDPDAYGRTEYSLEGEHLVNAPKRALTNNEATRGYDANVEAKLYVHSVATNTNREVSFAEAAKLTLDASTISPDGFSIESGSYPGGGDFFFLFGGYRGTDWDSKYLKGNGVSTKLDLQSVTTTSYYSGSSSFRFLGWIK